MGGSMTNLEMALSVAEAGTLLALVRCYRKQLIIRHLFIRFSDWCALKIDEMTESASWEIMDRQKTSCQESGYPITDDEARGSVPDVIIHAKAEWQDQTDYFQAMLKHNGVSPLGGFDLDAPVFNPGLSGIKTIPMPQSRTLAVLRTIKPPVAD
jgi:hypothetical protein